MPVRSIAMTAALILSVSSLAAKSMLDNEISTGKWALVGETICFQYPDDKEMECYRLEVAGNTATFTDQKGSGTRYEIVKGNPKGL